ncbi:DUF6783 domain-containing protein [Blautia sp.]|uniref:DUF6783 domain-containing protein n=1 Tax=Blautia sp. TaxID=1955243 RepID=UPI002FE6F5C4
MHAPLCGIFYLHSVDVARYAALIQEKSPTNCDAHLAESLFQTRSRMFYLRRSHILTTYLTSPIFFLYSSLISRNSFSPLIYGS